MRELQRITGATIDVPPSRANEEEGAGDQGQKGRNSPEEEVLVTIEGHFYAVQVITNVIDD